uniref:Mucin-5AC-like n=1 Tax=Bursaphelenchus xylophilus TaxID=6326 RepID=A0A1I7RUK6_BURXY
MGTRFGLMFLLLYASQRSCAAEIEHVGRCCPCKEETTNSPPSTAPTQNTLPTHTPPSRGPSTSQSENEGSTTSQAENEGSTASQAENKESTTSQAEKEGSTTSQAENEGSPASQAENEGSSTSSSDSSDSSFSSSSASSDSNEHFDNGSTVNPGSTPGTKPSDATEEPCRCNNKATKPSSSTHKPNPGPQTEAPCDNETSSATPGKPSTSISPAPPQPTQEPHDYCPADCSRLDRLLVDNYCGNTSLTISIKAGWQEWTPQERSHFLPYFKRIIRIQWDYEGHEKVQRVHRVFDKWTRLWQAKKRCNDIVIDEYENRKRQRCWGTVWQFQECASRFYFK